MTQTNDLENNVNLICIFGNVLLLFFYQILLKNNIYDLGNDLFQDAFVHILIISK